MRDICRSDRSAASSMSRQRSIVSWLVGADLGPGPLFQRTASMPIRLFRNQIPKTMGHLARVAAWVLGSVWIVFRVTYRKTLPILTANKYCTTRRSPGSCPCPSQHFWCPLSDLLSLCQFLKLLVQTSGQIHFSLASASASTSDSFLASCWRLLHILTHFGIPLKTHFIEDGIPWTNLKQRQKTRS